MPKLKKSPEAASPQKSKPVSSAVFRPTKEKIATEQYKKYLQKYQNDPVFLQTLGNKQPGLCAIMNQSITIMQQQDVNRESVVNQLKEFLKESNFSYTVEQVVKELKQFLQGGSYYYMLYGEYKTDRVFLQSLAEYNADLYSIVKRSFQSEAIFPIDVDIEPVLDNLEKFIKEKYLPLCRQNEIKEEEERTRDIYPSFF